MVHNVNFVGRKEELAFLEDAYDKDKSQMIVICGRRRVGKTCLLQKFIKDKKHTYFLCTKGNEIEQIRLLSGFIAENMDDEAVAQSPFSDWRTLFMYLQSKIGDERFVLVIDEFPYLINANSAVTSIFQKYWDEYLSGTNIMLVLCGSSISMMEREVLAYKSPLYGRRTGQWKVEPMSFEESLDIFPKKTDIGEAVRIYSITGGIPFYLTELDLDKTAIDNILENVARKGRMLYEEGEFLIREELREPLTYFSILSALSAGNTKQTQIADSIGMASTALPRYLSTLERLGFIEKNTPVTDYSRSKKTVYRIKDHFVNFWFSFIYPYKSYIEESNYLRYKEVLDRAFNKHVSFVFEDISQDLIRKKASANNLPFGFTKIGMWYGHYRDSATGMRKEVEIDIVALDEDTNTIAFVECKWKDLSKKDALDVLEKLMDKSASVQWNNDKRTEYFGLVAKRIDGKELLRKKGFVIFDLDDYDA
ncbi:MAG TPA: ATP-binding protein [Methanosarcinaceae archaeon]|nr:ATP-binding protein [Methanosarcinaceae archaeon]